MTSVGAAGIVLSLFAFAWAGTRKDNKRLALFVLVVLVHIASAVTYYFFVLENDADTKLYYYDYYGFFSQGFKTGTLAIVYVTQSMKRLFGGSYLDYFLLFQVAGVWAIALILRTIDEIAEALQGEWSWPIYASIFLPGTYFWTSAIGKDAPMFFASALVVWASLNLKRRVLAAIFGLIVMVAIRPHIALVTVIAYTFAMLTGPGLSTRAKAGFLITAAIGGIFLAGSIQASLSVDMTSMASVADYVEKTTDAGASGENTFASAPLVVKMFSLAYRPLFVDASGAFGLVASGHNLFLLYITYVFIRERKVLRHLLRKSLPIRFATFHLGGIVLLLSIMYYNVGLGLRQREMATPALLMLFCAVQFIRYRAMKTATVST